MSLSEKQRRHLRKLAHTLKPVVMIGQAGVSKGVLAETDSALSHHELIKVKVSAGERALRDQLIGEIVAHCAAELVQRIGNMAVLYRHNPEQKAPRALPPE